MNHFASIGESREATSLFGARGAARSRRQFLRGALGTAAVAGFAIPLLSACGSGASSHERVGAIADGLEPEAGPLRLFNYADYIAPDLVKKFEDENRVKVEITTFSTAQEAINKLASRAIQTDVYQAASETDVNRLVDGGLIQELNHSYLGNIGNLLPAFADPSYDPGLRYTLPFTTLSTGIGYRTDRIDPAEVAERGWDILLDNRFRGQVAVLDDYRTTLGIEMFRRGQDINSTDQAVIDAALQDLLTLADQVNVKVNITAYQDIPDGTTSVALCWSSDMVAAPLYMPESTSVDVLGWWYPEDNKSIVSSDLMTVAADAQNPVLAHRWLNFLLEPENAEMQFVLNGTQLPVQRVDFAGLALQAGMPPMVAGAVTTDAIAAAGVRLTELSVDADRKWADAWSTFKGR